MKAEERAWYFPGLNCSCVDRISTDCTSTTLYSHLCESVASQLVVDASLSFVSLFLFMNQVKFLPQSVQSAALTRDRQTTPFTDTLAAKAGVERGRSTEKKWIYQVVLHLKISLCVQGHNAGQGGEDGVTKTSTFLTSLHLERTLYSSQENHEC